jgi:hypothetical protein
MMPDEEESTTTVQSSSQHFCCYEHHQPSGRPYCYGEPSRPQSPVEESSPRSIQGVVVVLLTSTNIKTTKTKKRVSFSSNLLIRHTLHRKDYTDRERIRTWIQPQEMYRIRQNASLLADLLDQGGTIVNAAKDCTRGLESLSSTGLRREYQRVAMEVVLAEQAVQQQRLRNNNNDDDVTDGELRQQDVEEAIALLYLQCSYHCRMAAIQMGEMDAKIAAQYTCNHDDDDDDDDEEEDLQTHTSSTTSITTSSSGSTKQNSRRKQHFRGLSNQTAIFPISFN